MTGLFQLAQENKHEEITSIFNKQYRLDHLLGTLKKPYIALMDGIVSMFSYVPVFFF